MLTASADNSLFSTVATASTDLAAVVVEGAGEIVRVTPGATLFRVGMVL
jgi:hypothetical protein